ncbi:hypothetical protein OOK31_33095 [Streptomyces sp. NBC_00249]|uniref:hypothetical protein n=1 Tax=Streptomyces sp. NBC_00249 TaxID=2975690 RepID=UPI002256114D|nr:hypothetical protein [Streptomyces sp. NBC_00249]MCX5198670.1 hypothetical protein [Streptomyces sp. NBC_00249]
MPRKAKKARRLVVGDRTFLWKVRHVHRRLPDGRAADCRQTVGLRLVPGGGRLTVVFAEGPGRVLPGPYVASSAGVGTVGGGDLNLHEPGTVRALLDEALARGWRPEDRRGVELDGWTVLEAVAALRA